MGGTPMPRFIHRLGASCQTEMSVRRARIANSQYDATETQVVACTMAVADHMPIVTISEELRPALG